MWSKTRTSTDELATIARQFRYAAEQATSIDGALEKLRSAIAPSQRGGLDEFEGLLGRRTAAESDASRQSPAVAALARLLQSTDASAASTAAVLRAFAEHQAFSVTAAMSVWNEFAGFLTYLGAVLAVLIVVSLLFGFVLIPPLLALYRGFGAEPPALTHLVFETGAPLLALMQLALAVVIGWFAWFVLHLRSRLRRYAPMWPALARLPLVGRVASAYADYLWVSRADLLVAGGVSPDAALDRSSTESPSMTHSSWRHTDPGETSLQRNRTAVIASNLSTADRLGRLGAEIEFQRDAAVDSFLEALARCRRRTRVMLTVLVYALVALYVCAAYLPIFALGTLS